jgi:glycosyltransferase involved in cell wall biosynthesis
VRLLLISQYFYPENFQVNELALALRSNGHDIVVLTGQPNYPSGRFFPGYSLLGPMNEVYRGIKVVRAPVLPRRNGRHWELALNYVTFAISVIILGLPRLRGHFDACLVYCPSPITAAIPGIIFRLFWRKPLAIWVQDLWPESVFAIARATRKGWPKALLGRLVRWIYKHADGIWVQSQAFMASVEEHGGSPRRVAYVPNWAEDLYDSERWLNVVPEPLPENSLVFAGNIGRAQGLEVLVKAAAMMPPAAQAPHWVFVGDGTARRWLEDEVRRLKLTDRVTLLGRRPPEEMPKILKAAAGLLITLREEDVFAQTVPSKMQSCLAAGRPIIGVLSGEPARIVEEARCGYVSPPHDPSALSKVITSLLSLSTEQRDELGRNGHRYYKSHFTRAKAIARIESLLVQLVGTK